jgi:eukaryotic-like serine/threonine-protein kinase
VTPGADDERVSPAPEGAEDHRTDRDIPREVPFASTDPLFAPPGRAQPDHPHDLEKAHARAKLKASLFEIESEPLRIGRYPILGRLGQGGMGTVFVAYDDRLDRKIAIKVMLSAAGGGSTRLRERMRREAQAMARLSHPNIVAVHEVGELGEEVFIAMEFVRGTTLDAWLSERARSWREVLEVFQGAGRGLAAAHEAGLVHRDFKPSNVMVGEDGLVKILDFGLARWSAEDEASTPAALDPERSGSLTRTGAVVGTPAFMAPEQLRSEPATARSDQFSFCVALHTALFGQRPFAGRNVRELVLAVSEGRLVEPPKDAAVPAWVRRAVLRGLAHDPDGRFPSMTALLEALAHDPGARRRRVLGGGVALGLLVGGGMLAARLFEAEPCPDGRQALGPAWDDGRRATVGAVLRERSSHGAETWTRVEQALDGYADAWVAAHAQACRAHRAGSSSGLLYDRRLACLMRSRSALDALVEVLEDADAGVVDKAVSAVAGLPALSRCEDAEALLAAVEPPAEAIAPEVAALRETLARARSIEDAGRVVESTALADEVLARAEALAYRPLVAEARLRRGSGELLAGKAVEADESLGRAAWEAIEAGHDAVAAEAAARRIYARGEQLGRPAEAELELPWARALVERVDDDALTALVLHNAAVVQHRAGHLQPARALYREALATKQSFLPPEHPEIALTLANLGRVEQDLGDLGLAIDTLREAVRVTGIALGPRHPQRAIIATALGTALVERGAYGPARAELELADSIYRESLGEEALPRAHALGMAGVLAQRERRWDDARRTFELALAIAEPQVGAQHPMLADIRFALAEVRAAQGELEVAETKARATVADLESVLGNEHPYVGSGWLRLGRLLLSARAPARAVACIERALAVAQAAATPDPASVAWARLWLAHARAAADEHPTAVPALEPWLGALAAAFPDDSPPLVEARAVLAEAHLAAGDRERALALLVRHEAYMAPVRSTDDPELAWLRARIARLRHESAAAPEQRAAARAALADACRVLTASEAYRAEAHEARAWLDALPS